MDYDTEAELRKASQENVSNEAGKPLAWISRLYVAVHEDTL